MAASFDVKFLINRTSPLHQLQLTDTSTGFTLSKAVFKITYPNGFVANNTDLSSPDISSAGGTTNKDVKFDVNNLLIRGDYVIVMTAEDDSGNTHTAQRSFNLTWKEPTLDISNTSDVTTPEVKFKDNTVGYDNGNFTETITTRTLSSGFPSTSAVAAESPISGSGTSNFNDLEINVINSNNYYEGVYTPSLTVNITYLHTNGFLSVQYINSITESISIKRAPTQTELLTKINQYKDSINVYKSTNRETFDRLSEQYDLVIGLYSHLIDRVDATLTDGSEPILRELLEIVEPNASHTFQSTPITQFTSTDTESTQDIVGTMVSTNTENGIAVTYDDSTGKLNFDVADFTITQSGDTSGSVTVTNLASATLNSTLATVNSNVGSFGSTTAIPVITVNAKGLVTGVETAAISTTLDIAADSGTDNGVVIGTDTLTISGTSNEIETSVSGDTITIGLPNNVTISNALTTPSITVSSSQPTITLIDTDTNADAFISASSSAGSLQIAADFNNEANTTKIGFTTDGAEVARFRGNSDQIGSFRLFPQKSDNAAQGIFFGTETSNPGFLAGNSVRAISFSTGNKLFLYPTSNTSDSTVPLAISSDGSIQGTSIKDEDNMSSNSASHLATQQSIKAYVDSQVTAQDLDLQGDIGGALSIDLDSETLTLTGGTGIDTSGSSNTVTFDIDSTVATLTGSQTLTNKSLTAPTLTGDTKVNGDIDMLNKAGDGYQSFMSRNTLGSSAQMDLGNIGALTVSSYISTPQLRLQPSGGGAQVQLTTVQKSSASFVDNDTSLMTSAAIDDRINAAILTKDNTDEITEGSSNLYFTNERVDDRVNALLQAGSNVSLSYDDAANTLTISSTQLTNEQVQDVIGGMLGGDETGGISVTYDDINNEIDFAISSIPNSSLTNSSITVNGTSIALGASGTLDTGDIGEGSNLYFTNERVDDRVNALLQAGSNVSLTYDDTANTLTIAATQLTNEQVQDIIGGMLGGDETGGVSVTYDDDNNEIDFTISNVPNSSLANSSVTINGTAVSLGGSITLDTDDIGEGSSNLYFTNARARGAISENSTQLSYDSSTGVLTYTQGNTDTVSEGSSNLYYTDARVQAVSINNVVEDTTPQLGGTLDTNGNLIQFGDSGSTTDDRLQFGASQDLQIYHGGTHSFIDNNTGNIYIRNFSDDKNIHFQTDDGSGDITDYIVIHGQENIVKFQEHTRHLDNKQARFGTGSDLKIYHDETNSIIKNDTGDLRFIQNVDDGKIRFYNDDGSGAITEYFRIDGSAEETLFSKQIRVPDNVKIAAGGSSDLQIYHDGSHSYVDDFGVGNLRLRGNAGVQIMKASSTEIMGEFIADGAVNLYHDNSKKLETTNSGIDVTGNIVVSGTVDGVDIAARDAVLTSTTTTANAALPKAGGTMTGDTTLGTDADILKSGTNPFRVFTNGTLGLSISASQNAEFPNNVTATRFNGDFLGTINTATTATTQSAGDNSTKVATTAYADTAVSNLVDSSPDALNTLNELAAALGDDANFSTTVTNNLATKAPLSLPQFTNRVGIGVAPHATAALNITTTAQHLRLNNGSELGIIHLLSSGELEFWAHGNDETINFRTGSGSGVLAAHIDGINTTFKGNALIEGTLSVYGNSTIGDNFGDAHTINGKVTQITNDAEGYSLSRRNGGTQLLISANGDSQVTFGTDDASGNNTDNWAIGKDNTDNSFKISSGGTLGTGDKFTLTTSAATFAGRTDLQKDLRIRGNDASGSLGVVRFFTDSNNQLIIDTGNDGANRTIIDGSGNATFGGNITAAFDSNNSGNRLRIADTEGVSAAVRTYSTSDGTGLILNHYYAVSGSPYMRYSDFVSNMGDAAATTMRFLTKPHNGNPTVALTIDNSQKATFEGDVRINGNDLEFSGAAAKISGSNGGQIILNYNTTSNQPLIWYGGGTSEQFKVTNTGDATFAGTVNTGGDVIITNGSFTSSQSSATNPVARFTDAGVANYDWTFPDSLTIQLGTNTTSTKTFKLVNAGSGNFNFEAGDATFAGDITVNGGDVNVTKQNDAPIFVLTHDGTNPGTSDTLWQIMSWVDYNGTHENWGNITHRTTSDSSVRTELLFDVKSQSGNVQNALTLRGGSGTPNATFSGDLTVNGNLILGGTSNEIIKSDGSVRIDIDNNDNQSDRIFIVSNHNAANELFKVDESGNGTFAGNIEVSGTNAIFGASDAVKTGIEFGTNQVKIRPKSSLSNGRIFRESNFLIYDGPSAGHKFAVAGNATTNVALTLDSSQNATFSNIVNIGNRTNGSSPDGILKGAGNDGTSGSRFQVTANSSNNTRRLWLGTSHTEAAMTITENKVGIGTTTLKAAEEILHLFSSAPILKIQDGGDKASNASGFVQFWDHDSQMGHIGIVDGGTMRINNINSSLLFHSSNNLALTLDTSQNATFAGTITAAGGSSNNNDDANILTLNASEHARLLVDTSSTSGHRATLALESNGNELTLTTTGSASELNAVGNLTIQNDSNDSDIIFKSDDGSGGLATYFALDGGITRTVAYKNFNFQDNVKLEMGTGADLQIYHNGNDSYISDTGTGDLRITSSAVKFYNASISDFMATMTDGGSVDLYHNGNLQAGTMSDGWQVPAGKGVYFDGGSHTYIKETSADVLKIFVGSDGEHVSFSGGNTTFAGNIELASSKRIRWGAGDAQIEEGATANYSLDFSTYDGSNMTTALTLLGNNNATFAGHVKAPFFTTDGGRGFKQDSVAFVSTYSDGSDADAVNDLGKETNRWRDLYLYGDIKAYNGLDINSIDQDKDIVFKGNDGGSTVTALTLDMSEGGNATFAGGLIVNEGSNDADFRVESNGEEYMLRVDGGNNRVGIATQNPSTTFHVTGDSTFAGNITTTGSQFSFVSSTDSNVGLLIRDETYVSDEADITATRLASGNNLTLGLAGQAGINFYVGGSNVANINSSGNATFSGNVGLADNKKLTFGAAPDFEIYHNSTTNVNHISSLLSRQLSISADTTIFTGDVEIHKSGNDTTGKLTISGNNNTGTPGQKTSGTIEHRGEHLKTVITHNGSDVITIGTGTQTTFAGAVTVGGNILPSAGNSYDVGAAGTMFNNGYFLNVTAFTSLSAGAASFTGNITTSGFVGLNATSTLFFDANTHGHTLIKEISDDRLGVTVGGRLMLDLGENGDSSSYIDMHAPTVSIHSDVSSFPLFQIKNTNADAQAPRLALIKDSASPADNDETGRIYMYGDNDAGEQIETFLARTIFTDVSDGSEDSKFEILTYKAGTQTSTLSLESGDATFGGDVFTPGLYVNATSAVAGTQVAIVSSGGSENLQRWGSSSDGGSQNSYRFRIDQNFHFIGNSGGGDTVTIQSNNGNISTSGSINLSDSQPIKWGTENILSHNGTQTYLGSATSASVLTLEGTAATFAGDIDVNGVGAFGGTGSFRTFVKGSASGSSIEFGTNADNDSLGVLGTFASAFICSTTQSLGFKWQHAGNDRMTLTTGGNFAVTGTGDFGGTLTVTTATGEITIGSSNTSGAHIYTDRPRFFFNKTVRPLTGIFASYQNDLKLQRDENSSHQMTLSTTAATFTHDVVAFSDKKLKKNVKTLDGNKVYDMRGVSFTRKDNGEDGSGVIAQEMQKVAPELVNNTDGTLGVSYGNITGYLIEAIKDLKAEVEDLKKQLKNK